MISIVYGYPDGDGLNLCMPDHQNRTKHSVHHSWDEMWNPRRVIIGSFKKHLQAALKSKSSYNFNLV